ncbi:hypothetical protein K2173_001649 [Erythroxylum novogranatense]|uniref:Homeobox domain-containing protein n=1 Tax=Erythroxylum novogranatense TaxID=1862640 RepID=A0AAV8T5D8_9ROSI|nr:hypothetical protein K2173_001649 [Erythroxylum novogranatense]
MASSNRHWPSMFKSKPCSSHHNQWQHDINSPSLMSSGCLRTPYTSVPGCDERTPEPKPRWNPKPEQIRILEAIFNSGMVNPPRDEIRKIRAQLQEYGQVGDANVFYWFQNRKSRSKHKLRNLQNSKQQNSQQQTPQTPPSSTSVTTLRAPSSSSSSSEKSSPRGSKRTFSLSSPGLFDVSNSPTASVNQTYFQAPNEFVPEHLLIPVQQQTGAGASGTFTQGINFSEVFNVAPEQGHTIGPCTSLLLSEILNSGATKKNQQDHRSMKMQPQICYTMTTPINPGVDLTPLTLSHSTTNSVTVPSPIAQIQGAGEEGRSTVFINDMAFDVAAGPFNVREAFGDDAVLVHSSGQPVLTNEWGVTLQSLQQGAFYYLVPISMGEHM